MTKEPVLYQLVDVSDSAIVLNEIKQILALMVDTYDPSNLEMIYVVVLHPVYDTL